MATDDVTSSDYSGLSFLHQVRNTTKITNSDRLPENIGRIIDKLLSVCCCCCCSWSASSECVNKKKNCWQRKLRFTWSHLYEDVQVFIGIIHPFVEKSSAKNVKCYYEQRGPSKSQLARKIERRREECQSQRFQSEKPRRRISSDKG